MVIILSKQSLNILKGYSEAYNLHPPPKKKGIKGKRQKDKTWQTDHCRTK
jgi:hypothetical protein